MTSTLEVRPEALPEAPIEALPATFNVKRGGFGQTSGLTRKGTFVGRMDLTVDDRRLTVAGLYLTRKTAVRTAVHWIVFLATLAVVTFALFLVTDLAFALGVSIVVAGVVVMLLEWARRRTTTDELALSDVTVEKIKGRGLWLRGPFELERPEARQKLVVRARTKDDAAALVALLD
jgi:hypothetical protein